MKNTSLFLLVVSFALLSACATKLSENTSSEKLHGDYGITKLNGQSTIPDLRINFDSNKLSISGFSGCNRFMSSYTQEGNQLSFGQIAGTRMACLKDDVSKVEQDFLTALSSVASYKIKGENIQLFDVNKKEVLSGSPFLFTMDKDYSLKYSTSTMMGSKDLIHENNSMTCKTWSSENGDSQVSNTLSAATNENILLAVNELPFDQFNSLEAPSNEHTLDGAAHAVLTITYKGETYTTPAFDHGNPNPVLARILALVLKEDPCADM